MTKYLKPWGGHHAILALLIAALLGPVANAVFWFGKELGEATERADGTRKALKGWRDIKRLHEPFGIWEHWDWITPSLAGAIIGALI